MIKASVFEGGDRMQFIQWLRSLFGISSSKVAEQNIDGFCILDSKHFYHTSESIPQKKERKKQE